MLHSNLRVSEDSGTMLNQSFYGGATNTFIQSEPSLGPALYSRSPATPLHPPAATPLHPPAATPLHPPAAPLASVPSVLHENVPIEDTEIPADVLAFAKEFKNKRIELGYTQADVGRALGHITDASLSQTTICRFESFQLSVKNMYSLKPLLEKVLHEMQTDKNLLDRLNSGQLTPQVQKRRRRTSIEAAAKRALEDYFNGQPTPSGEEQRNLAATLKLEKNVVGTWFCNRRQKQKRDGNLVSSAHNGNVYNEMQIIEDGHIYSVLATSHTGHIYSAPATPHASHIYSAPATPHASHIYSAPVTPHASHIYSAPATPHASHIYSAPATLHAGHIYSAPATPHAGHVYSAPVTVQAGHTYRAPTTVPTCHAYSAPTTPHSSQVSSASCTPHASQAYSAPTSPHDGNLYNAQVLSQPNACAYAAPQMGSPQDYYKVDFHINDLLNSYPMP